MKKEYKKPVIEKITFDYKTQIVTSSNCTGSIINIATSVDQCGEGTKNYIGWNSEHPGPF
jgi:hypothetical protein